MVGKKLPDGWVWAELDDVTLEYVSGGTPSTKVAKYWSGGIPWTRSANITAKYLRFGEKFISSEAITDTAANIVPKNNVLVATRVGVGKSTVNLIDVAISQDLTGLILDLKRILPIYLVYYLHSPRIQKTLEQYSRGTTIKGIQRSDLSHIKVPLPPLDTQRKIVAILDKAEATQRLRADADALMQQLLQSVYVSVFGDPVSNPQGWDIVNLESVCKKITDGEHVTPRRSQSGIYLLSARNIKDHEIELSDVDYIDQEEYDRISRRIIPRKGDVLISCSGSVGRVSQITDDIKFQMVRSVALIRPDNQKLDSTYLEYTFDTNYLKTQIAQSVNQSSQANLFQNKIRELRIPIPPMHLQKVFADIAERKERIAENQKINSIKAQELYNSLLSKAFTGDLVA
ncbi:MAG: hypothetical protein GX965_10995 [Methanoculleus bourgensis]|uniref:restriction endonuclease subunit S n=1 Tax=Methanoculleus bourgensis TaxID=83986 RepID=UPI0017BCBE83|nr:hypothetical protein [Methanoculleus bourgensis]